MATLQEILKSLYYGPQDPLYQTVDLQGAIRKEMERLGINDPSLVAEGVIDADPGPTIMDRVIAGGDEYAPTMGQTTVPRQERYSRGEPSPEMTVPETPEVGVFLGDLSGMAQNQDVSFPFNAGMPQITGMSKLERIREEARRKFGLPPSDTDFSDYNPETRSTVEQAPPTDIERKNAQWLRNEFPGQYLWNEMTQQGRGRDRALEQFKELVNQRQADAYNMINQMRAQSFQDSANAQIFKAQLQGQVTPKDVLDFIKANDMLAMSPAGIQAANAARRGDLEEAFKILESFGATLGGGGAQGGGAQSSGGRTLRYVNGQVVP